MIVYHYRSYRNALRSSDTDIAITKIVIWEQVGICYSLLSITWPFSKPFINGFDTALAISALLVIISLAILLSLKVSGLWQRSRPLVGATVNVDGH